MFCKTYFILEMHKEIFTEEIRFLEEASRDEYR